MWPLQEVNLMEVKVKPPKAAPQYDNPNEQELVEAIKIMRVAYLRYREAKWGVERCTQNIDGDSILPYLTPAEIQRAIERKYKNR